MNTITSDMGLNGVTMIEILPLLDTEIPRARPVMPEFHVNVIVIDPVGVTAVVAVWFDPEDLVQFVGENPQATVVVPVAWQVYNDRRVCPSQYEQVRRNVRSYSDWPPVEKR
jgi:hypothetical protein